MATRYTTIGTAAAALTAIGITIGTAADGPAVRSAIGAQAEVLTTNGDLVVRSGGATTRLGVAGAADGGVLTVANGAPQWAAPSSGSSVTTLNASDCVAEAGSESASISGTGSASSATLTATITSRSYGSGGMTAARIVCSIPAGAKLIDVAVQVTNWTGTVTGGWRYLTIALRDSNTGSNPTTLYGFGHADATGCYYGNLLTGANGGLGPVTAASAPTAADRWIRATFDTAPTSLALLSGTGSAGARPTTWSAPGTAIPLVTGSFGAVPDTSSATALVFVFQSFAGTGGSNSITIKPIVRVWL